ncbi:hypothetical protein BX600DRAFT_451931 [Xylariales sp. PMI_506]|nr:hypothetical protein BX600DRAFT_451931 [Xylariales sp. PMI_506]
MLPDVLSSTSAGDQRTVHRVAEVTSGWEVGLRIWTREGPRDEEAEPLVKPLL